MLQQIEQRLAGTIRRRPDVEPCRQLEYGDP